LFAGLLVNYTDIHFELYIAHGSFESVCQSSWKGKNVALKHTDIPSGIDKEYMIASSHEPVAVGYIHK